MSEMKPFGARRFTSFGDEGFCLQELSKINVFIGKNNTGKSNILKFIGAVHRHLKGRTRGVFADIEIRHWDKPEPPLLIIGATFKDLGIDFRHFHIPQAKKSSIDPEKNYLFTYDLPGRKIVLPNPFEADPQINAAVWRELNVSPIHANLERTLASKFNKNIYDIIQQNFRDVFHIPQFREFRYKEGLDSDQSKTGFIDEDNVAGYRLAERLAWMKSPGVKHNREQERFQKITEWVRELLELPNLEIDFEDPNGDRPRAVILKINGLRRYLESFGSGIHQLVIMCFAISLKKNTIICIEEPESFLHPGLQRSLINFLRKTSNTYFISTHSNVFLDATKHADTRIYHVNHENLASKVKWVETTPDAYHVLEDLSYHASDLMQANGVIWVEGPTDRMFLLKWLELRGSQFKEGVHFAIMFYGGKLLSHLSFDPDSSEEYGLIPLLKMNRNAVVIVDSDREAKRKQPKKAKKELVKRIESEMKQADGYVWITKGREIENYLSERTLNNYCRSKWSDQFRLKYDHYKNLDDMIRLGERKRRKFNYSANKVKYCREILTFIEEQDLDVLSLRSNMGKLMSTIEKWNPKIMTRAFSP